MTNLTYGTPEEAGMDPDRIAALKDRAPDWVDGFRMRSGVLLAARRGKIVFHEAYGPLTAEPDSPPAVPDTIFQISSITKTITATAAMMLVEDGLLGLNRPLKEYLPEVCGEGTDDVEVQHLFTHTSGFSWDEEEKKIEDRIGSASNLSGDRKAGLHKFNAMKLACLWDMKSHWAPGSRMEYCNHNYELVSEIVRRLLGKSIADFASERIFGPLGMIDTSYIQDKNKLAREVRRGDDVPLGSVSSDPILGGEGIWNMKAPWGHSGVMSTSLDLATFGQMFLNGGTYDGQRLLSRPTVQEMSRNQIPGIGAEFLGQLLDEASWGLGWMVQHDQRWKVTNSTLTPKGTFYHGGAGGHLLWIDPLNEIVGVYLSVCLDMNMEINKQNWNADLFQNMVTAAVVD